MSTNEIWVATDSAASFRPGEALDLGIEVMPLHLMWPDGTQSSDAEMSPQEFYARMEKEGIPQTSGANVGEFMSFYRGLAERGAEKILSIHITGKKSVVLNSAIIASHEIMDEFPGLEIRTVDSKTLCVAQLFVVEHARNMVIAGASFSEAETAAIEVADKTSEEAVLSTLTNVLKSGRLKGASALAAAALGILPIISITDGDIITSEKVMGNPSRARRRMVDRIAAQVDSRGVPERIGVLFTYDREVGDEVTARLLEKIGTEVIIETPREAGPILGVHTGPGAAGVGIKWK
jgi:DegV family protein with EDD domain